MYKRTRIATMLSALVVAAALTMPAPAHPWGWATHVYLMENTGPATVESFYGSVLPDFPQVIPDTRYLFFLQEQTHYKFDRLTDKAASFGLDDLGAGFARHNEKRGADHSAHVEGFTNPAGTGGYVVHKSALLLDQSIDFPSGPMTIAKFLESVLTDNGIDSETAAPIAAQIATEVAHSVIEDAVDILMQEEEVAPMAGCLLLYSALARDDASVQALLVKAYGRNFAARFKIPFETAAAIIAGAEAGFQGLMASYGGILCPLIEPFWPVGGVATLEAFRLNEFIKSVTRLPVLVRPVTPVDAMPVLLAGLPLVQEDYQTELSETLASLQGQQQ